jgi:hypothetical protein
MSISENAARARLAGWSDDVTPGEVREFWRFMLGEFNTELVEEGRPLDMQVLVRALRVLGIVDQRRFLRSFAITLGRQIYLPFRIGVPQPGWDLWSQVVVCVHEHQHVVQYDRDETAFLVDYLTSRSARARFEAEAYRSNLELEYWRTGKVPSADSLAERLLEYGCGDEDVEVAECALALSAVAVRRRGVLNEASHVALEWLNENLPHRAA